MANNLFISGGRPPPVDDAGFMLLEALLAILILSIVGLSLMNLSQNISRGAVRVRESLCAKWVIRDQIALLAITMLPDNRIVPKGETVMCDATWQWVIAPQKINDPRIRRYTIQVFKNGHQQAHQDVILPVR